ncbi:DUF5906 domain-containing protein [Desulfuromonas sp. TF]|uniref:DUF5906 domain-containing protein n=1 Tax=Desulfuromonas sp. TF TaxID=1232410 RepID=UPI00040446F9|nr:DUF5906 domain-containing protein [Desulfuromonas sp. TF]
METSCPNWLKFLEEVVGNEEEIRLLQEFFGSCLAPETYGRMLLMVGSAASGKSVLVSVVASVLGSERVGYHPLFHLKDPFVRADLSEKRLNVSCEDVAKGIDQSYLKAFIAGDLLNASFKYKPYFSFRPETKFVSMLNYLPENPPAIARRLLVVHCPRQFRREDMSVDLDRKLAEEREGILAWLEEGLERLRKRGGFGG